MISGYRKSAPPQVPLAPEAERVLAMHRHALASVAQASFWRNRAMRSIRAVSTASAIIVLAL